MIIYRIDDRFAPRKLGTSPSHDMRFIDDIGRMAMPLSGANALLCYVVGTRCTT